MSTDNFVGPYAQPCLSSALASKATLVQLFAKNFGRFKGTFVVGFDVQMKRV